MGRGALAQAVLLFALAGCAGLPTPPVSSSLPDARYAAARASAFQVSGRITARKGEHAMTGSFRWQHDPQADDIDLGTPLGQTIAHLVRSSDGVRYRAKDGKEVSAPDWEALTSQELGWPLPVGKLVYWIQAAPAPDATFTESADEQHRPQELHQLGWTVVYQSYYSQGLPARMRLSLGEIDIRLAIDTWQDPDSPPTQ